MATFAEQMLEKIEDLLLENVGVSDVSIDGQSVKYRDLEKLYKYWKKKVAKENGEIPLLAKINIDKD